MRSAAVGVGLAAVVGVTTFDDGGFDRGSQALFAALAGAALLGAFTLDAGALLDAARTRVALALGCLAALSAASALWTLDGGLAALRAGLLVGGYAAVFLTAAVLARHLDPWWFAGAITALALIQAVVGLHAVLSHSLPEAERIDGVWRPGGSFQYPPALALLQLGALPTLCSLIARPSLLISAAAGGGAVLAGMTLGLAGNRLALAMAAVLLIAMIARRGSGERGRRAPAMAAALVLLGALVAPALLGTPATNSGAHTVRRAATGGAGRRLHTPASRPRDLLHGRGREWEAALETFSEHPLLGAGAGAYFTASARHQGPAPTLYAHDLALELAAELGVAGLLLFLALYGSLAVIVVRAVDGQAFWLLAPITVAFLVSNMLDWTWHLAGLGAVWAAAAGALQGSGETTSPGTTIAPGEVR
jgi:O-antigen ligase